MGSENGYRFDDLTTAWLEAATRAMQAWQPLAGSTASPEAFRAGRADLVQVWSDCCQQWMRSSTFLDAQKECLDASLAFRKQFRAALRRMLRETPIAGREDIDALAAALQRTQRRILDRLDETAERLQSLEARLDALGAGMQRLAGLEDAADGAGGGGKDGKAAADKEPAA